MNSKRRNSFILPLIIVLFVSSCYEKTVIDPSLINGSTFFKQESLYQNDKNCAITTLSNGGYLAAGSAGDFSYFNDLKLTYFNQYGKIENKSKLSSGLGFRPFITKTKSHEIILNDYGFPAISKFDENGVQIYREILSNRGLPTSIVGLHQFSRVIIGNDDNYYIALHQNYKSRAAIEGNGLYGVIQIDAKTGLETKFDTLTIQDLGGIPISIFMLDVKNNKQWIAAQLSISNPSLSNEYDRQKIVVYSLLDGKMTNNIDLKLNNFDRGESLQCSNVLNNGDFILIGGESSVDFSSNNNSRKSISVYTINSSLDESWRSTVNLEATSIVSRQVKENSNGEICIVGTCKPDKLSYNSGFILKLSSTGELVMQHFFDLGQSADFEDFIELPDKSFIFVGGVNNFGNGIEKMNSFTLKTDANLNF